MSARVIELDSRRPVVPVTCTCRPDRLCYPHRVSNLAVLLRLHREAQDGELLIPVASLYEALDVALDVLEGIADECLPDERTAR